MMATLELSDDWRTEEPLAYLVKLFDDTIEEYRVFANESEAQDCAHDQAEVSGCGDWDVYPLYAGVPLANPQPADATDAREDT